MAKVWMPVEDDFKANKLVTWNDDIGEGDGTPDWWIAIENIATPLPDDIRLCLAVDQPDAPAGAGVPSEEVRAMILAELGLRRIAYLHAAERWDGASYHDDYLAKVRVIDKALAWLAEQEG